MSAKDYAPGISFAIAWLHERAKEMRDPHATQVLNGAAFGLGNAKAKGGFVLNDELSRLRSALEADRPIIEAVVADKSAARRALQQEGSR